MKPLALNLTIALIWLLLGAEATVSMFVVGYLLGFALIALFRSVVGAENYVRRAFALARFLAGFTAQFLAANAKVAWAVLARKPTSLHPDFVTYDVRGLSRAELLLLSYCVTLTPGTTTVEISPDFGTLTFHALDADHPEQICAAIDRTTKRWILAFTR